MWDGSTSQISQQPLLQSIQIGSLKLCHFEVKALKLSCVKRYVATTMQHGSFYDKYFINGPSLTFCFTEIMFYHQN